MRKDTELLAAMENVIARYREETSSELAREIILTWLDASIKGAEAKFMQSYLGNFSIGDLKRVHTLLTTEEEVPQPDGEKKVRKKRVQKKKS